MINRIPSRHSSVALVALGIGVAGLFSVAVERHRANVVAALAVEARIAEIVVRDGALLEVYPRCDDGSVTTEQDVIRSLLLAWEHVARVAGVITGSELRAALDYYMSDSAMRKYWERHGSPDRGGFGREVDRAITRTAVKSGPERAAG